MTSTLRALRRLFAAHAGGSPQVGVATSGSTKGYIEDTLLMSSIDQGDQWKESYLHRPDAVVVRDRVRQVKRVDLDQGFVYPDWPAGQEYTNSPYDDGEGEVYEILSPWFHPTQQIHSYINEALKYCLVPGEVVVPALANVYRQPISSFRSWLTDASLIYQIGYLWAAESRENVDPYSRLLHGGLEQNGADLYLGLRRTAFATTTSGTIRTSNFLAPNLTTSTTAGVFTLGTGAVPIAPFYAVIESEIIQVTATSGGGTGWTMVRGQLGTTAASHVADTAVTVTPLFFLRGMFPAYYLCRPAGGTFGSQQGLVLDTDEALPAEQWVVAGALKEAWTSAPHIMEQIAETHRVTQLQAATIAFQRWQEQTYRRANLQRTFRQLEVATI